jgi:hypothetical protein
VIFYQTPPGGGFLARGDTVAVIWQPYQEYFEEAYDPPYKWDYNGGLAPSRNRITYLLLNAGDTITLIGWLEQVNPISYV